MRFTTIFLLLIFCLTTALAFAQVDPKAVKSGKLPKRIDESSGLAIAGEHSLWTVNDRGSGPEFFEVDVHGDLIRVVKMIGVNPIDMEDMGQDETGILYFADTGNNKKDRTSLKIYVVDPKQIEVGKVHAATIEFTLPDNGLQSDCHYDFEAIVVSQGEIFIFSKDRCDTKDNSLMYYTVPTVPGVYEAEFKGEFFWEDAERSIKITSADISFDGKKLVLLSRDALHFFFAYRKNEFFDGAYRYLKLDNTKKEAVVHLNDCDLYITEEAEKNELAHIYKLNLCRVKFD